MTLLTRYYLDDGRTVVVSEVASDVPFARALRGPAATQELYRRHRWWGPPSEWQVRDQTKNFLGLNLGWLP